MGALAAGLLAIAAGCQPDIAPPPAPEAIKVYDGLLLSGPQVVMGLRTIYAPVRTIWARHDFSITVLDKKGKQHNYEGDGTLLLRKPPLDSPRGTPTELRLKGSKDIVGEVFDLGANRDAAWCIMRGDVDAMGWLPQGVEASFDPQVVPVRPDLVAEVLGLGDWPADVSKYPAPVVVYDPKSDAYRITLVEPAGEGRPGLAARREVYADRLTLMIKRIVFYGSDGRPVVEATLSKWTAVPGTVKGFAPADIVLSLPLSRATMRFVLRDVAATRNGFPADRSFAFPADPGVSKVFRLDQQQQ